MQYVLFRIFFVVFAMVSFAGCASSHQWWPDIDSEKECKNKFAREGHISTTHTVALMAGLDQFRAERYALFSQAPDEIGMKYGAVQVSIWGTLLPCYCSYRHNVTSGLHSLHGGDAEEVKKRRAVLENIAKEFVRRDCREEDWKTGFVLHALGDSYAHTYQNQSGEEHAYGQWIGHAVKKGYYEPDSIRENIQNYLGYVNALYRIFDQGKGNAGALEKYRQYIHEVIQKETNDDVINERVNNYNRGMHAMINYCEHARWAEEIQFAEVENFLDELVKKLEKPM